MKMHPIHPMHPIYRPPHLHLHRRRLSALSALSALWLACALGCDSNTPPTLLPLSPLPGAMS